MKLFPVKRSPGVGETGISSRVPSCERGDTVRQARDIVPSRRGESREEQERADRYTHIRTYGEEPYPPTIQIADYAPGFYVPSNWAALPLGKDRTIARSALVNP